MATTAETSGTYNFQDVTSDQLIWEAYSRIGIRPQKPTAELIQEAQRSINLLMCQWINKSVNLWSYQQEMLTLVQNQITYQLPTGTSDIAFADLRSTIRQLSGTASSSSGVAANAFDNNPATACTETAPNGWIAYGWGGATYEIGMVGIQSLVDATYTLALEYSNDGVSWTQINSTGPVFYTAQQLSWQVVLVPTPAKYFRIRETGGATLNISELYFNTVQNDTVMTRMSYAEWMQINNKQQFPSRPSQFFVNRLVIPTITLWPPPSAMYNALFYVRITMPQDIGTLQQTPALPGRFYEALVSGLAFLLGMKFPEVCPLDKLQFLMNYATAVFNEAKTEDRERVPTRIFGDYMQGGQNRL